MNEQEMIQEALQRIEKLEKELIDVRQIVTETTIALTTSLQLLQTNSMKNALVQEELCNRIATITEILNLLAELKKKETRE